MAHEEVLETRGEAYRALADGDFDHAGWQFSALAHMSLGLSQFDSVTAVTPGLIGLLKASLCFRIAGDESRAVYRARSGMVIIEEIAEFEPDSHVIRGLFAEYSGDFKSFAGQTGGVEAYERAAEHYEQYEDEVTVDECIGQLSEPPFHENTELLRELLQSADVTLAEDVQTEIEFRSPVERARFKSARMADLTAEIVDRQEWEW